MQNVKERSKGKEEGRIPGQDFIENVTNVTKEHWNSMEPFYSFYCRVSPGKGVQIVFLCTFFWGV